MERVSRSHEGLHTHHYSGLYTVDTIQKPLWNAKPRGPRVESVEIRQEPKRDTIGGLRPTTFWLVLLLIVAVVIAASVGGAVGGTLNSQRVASLSSPPPTASKQPDSANAVNFASTSPISSSATVKTASTSQTSTCPTVTATKIPTQGVTDCPTSNGTLFTPVNPTNGKPLTASYRKYCGQVFNDDGQTLASAFVMTFDACIALCSNFNFFHAKIGTGLKCTNVNYGFGGVYPNNCWISNVSLSLKPEQNTDCAQLV